MKIKLLLSAGHPNNKHFLKLVQVQVDRWNAFAESINATNRVIGGNRDFMKPRKNSYLHI